MLLVEKLDNLQRAHPHISEHGQLYKEVSETKRRYSRVTLWTMFVSNENTHLLRDHKFNKEKPLAPYQWSEFFRDKLAEIHRDSVLPGIAVRTNLKWSVQRILGWVGDAEHASDDSPAHSKRHKAKNKGA